MRADNLLSKQLSFCQKRTQHQYSHMSCAYLIEKLEDVVDEDVSDDDFGGNDEAEAHCLQVPRVSP